MGTPRAEIEIDAALAERLLAAQFPDLAHLPVQGVTSGWDNVIFRLGDSLCVRLPRREVAVQLIANEQIWLPRLAASLPIAVPAAIRIGLPTDFYPWKWSVLPWIEGIPASHSKMHSTEAFRLAQFLRLLHVPAPPDAPRNPVRGIPLCERAAMVEERMQRLAKTTDSITLELRRVWIHALNASLHDAPATWIHGDLHPGNILVENGVISGIIDWGDMAAGDPATDLAAFWMLFEEQNARRQALTEYGVVSSALFQRALGWAILFGVMLLDVGMTDTPTFTQIGKDILRRVCTDAA
jgi:aminoglycoside phosphotransferase (APT) family kinase protein